MFFLSDHKFVSNEGDLINFFVIESEVKKNRVKNESESVITYTSHWIISAEDIVSVFCLPKTTLFKSIIMFVTYENIFCP